MEHGSLYVLLSSNSPIIRAYDINDASLDGIEGTETFEEARIRAYERHGVWLLAAWFPIGFYLLASQRYYKTRWLLMHHLHNVLGLFVVAVTVIASLQAYAHVNWE